AARGLGDELRVHDEGGQAERDRLLPLEIVDRGAALQVDSAVNDQRYAVGGGDELLTDLEARHLQELPQVVDDLHAQVDRISDRLTGIVGVGKRNRCIAHPENDLTGIAELLQRSRFLRCGRNGGGEQGYA